MRNTVLLASLNSADNALFDFSDTDLFRHFKIKTFGSSQKRNVTYFFQVYKTTSGGPSPLKGFAIDVKAGIVTGGIGVCSRQAPTVTRANGNVRGAAYLASPQLRCFSSSREWISCQLAASPPTRCWDNLHFEARRGFEWLLVPGLLCGIVRRQRLVPCLANLAVSTALQPHPASLL